MNRYQRAVSKIVKFDMDILKGIGRNTSRMRKKKSVVYEVKLFQWFNREPIPLAQLGRRGKQLIKAADITKR